jgi:hypothetical protein
MDESEPFRKCSRVRCSLSRANMAANDIASAHRRSESRCTSLAHRCTSHSK